jgi:hypothetical protein
MRACAALAGAALVGLFVPAARADYIPWEYKWTNSPLIIPADPPGKGYVQLTNVSKLNAPPGTLIQAAGDTDLIATNISVHSKAPLDSPDNLSPTKYTLTLFILDDNSGKSGTLSFTGELYGSFSSLSSSLKNTFLGDKTQTLVLGNDLYTVNIGPYLKPGPPGSSAPGGIGADATVTVTKLQQTPEPSALLLACIGLPLAGYQLRLRRTKKG